MPSFFVFIIKDVPKLRKILVEKGFSEVFRDDSRDCNFVLQDRDGNQIDVHSYTFDEKGRNIYGVAYLPEHLTGKGTINGCSVKCVPPEWMVKFHTGYELDENDYYNVRALCEAFDLKLPDGYEKYRRVEKSKLFHSLERVICRNSNNEKRQKTKLADQNLRNVRSFVYVAQKVGKGLGRS